jgi:predicted RNA-binding protein with PUA-like domain
MSYWLVKQEPEKYDWDTFVADKGTMWDGVRNFQARNNLRAMKRGDEVFFYASNGPKTVIGVAKVTKAAYPDPTAEEGDWSAVDLKPIAVLKTPVSLATIKQTPALKNLLLVRNSRISVSPVTKREFDVIVKLGGGLKPVGR